MPKPYCSTWLSDTEINAYVALAILYANIKAADFHIQEIVNLSPLELLSEAPLDLSVKTNTAMLQLPALDKLPPHVQMCAKFAQALVRVGTRSAHDSETRSNAQTSESNAKLDTVACLRAAVLTAQMVLLVQSVKAENVLEERHGLLLHMLTLLLMTAKAHAWAEAEAKTDAGSLVKSEVQGLVKALVKSAMTMLQNIVKSPPHKLEHGGWNALRVVSAMMECATLLPMFGHEFAAQGIAEHDMADKLVMPQE